MQSSSVYQNTIVVVLVIVLFGLGSVEHELTRPELRQLRTRISVSAHLMSRACSRASFCRIQLHKITKTVGKHMILEACYKPPIYPDLLYTSLHVDREGGGVDPRQHQTPDHRIQS